MKISSLSVVWLRLLLFVVGSIGIVPLSSFAQTPQPAIFKITSEGSARFSAEQISSASGLKLGQPADDSALSAAADLLSKSGAFSEVSYRYITASGKMTVVFIVVDEPKTVLCTFDNFVWFSPQETDQAVRSEVPLYDGRVPLDGDIVPAVATALEHLLAQHHVADKVTYLPAAKAVGTEPDEFRYSASGNLPLISSIEFSGGPLSSDIFAIPKQRLIGHPFSAAYVRSLIQNELDVAYENRSYLRAHFNDPQISFLPGSTDSDPGIVKLVFTVVPGAMYSWHGADWDGNTLYPSAQLDRDLGMQEGEPAALDKISAGMDSVRDAYGLKGFLTASISPEVHLDDATHLARYSFHLKEGNQYHMGKLIVTGYDDKTAERVQSSWRLKSGAIYDSSYLKEFGKTGLPEALSSAPPALRAGRISMSVRPNPNDLTVDVTVSRNVN